jgi:hypothetical protein
VCGGSSCEMVFRRAATVMFHSSSLAMSSARGATSTAPVPLPYSVAQSLSSAPSLALLLVWRAGTTGYVVTETANCPHACFGQLPVCPASVARVVPRWPGGDGVDRRCYRRIVSLTASGRKAARWGGCD